MFLLLTELGTTITQTQKDTAIPDDDDDIASLASQPTATLQPSSFWLCPPVPEGQFASFFLMFLGDLRLDALFEDHGVSWMVIEDMFALDRAIYQRCFPAQLPLSDRQRFNWQKFAHLLQDVGAAAALPPHSAHFPLQLLDLAHVWSERGDNDIHIFDVLPLAAAVYIFLSNRIPRGLRLHDTLAHSRLLAASPTTHCRCAQRGQQLPRQQPGSKFSNATFLSGKNNSSSRNTRTSRVRHPPCSQTVRISLQRPTFGSPWSELQSQSSQSICLVHLRRPLGVLELTAAHLRCHNGASPLLLVCATQLSLSVLCILLPVSTESVPITFSLLGCSNSLALEDLCHKHVSWRRSEKTQIFAGVTRRAA